MTHMYQGIWPVAPAPFHADGALDLAGMTRVLDCMIDMKVDGICILANFSEQFLISDDERYFDSSVFRTRHGARSSYCDHQSFRNPNCGAKGATCQRSGRSDCDDDAPYHGALLKGNAQQNFEQFEAVGAIGIPIMVQDAPLSGVDLPVSLLVRMAREIEMVKLFKIECPQAANKIRALIAEGGSAIEGPFDGEEGITLLADLNTGATGGMTSAMIPDLIKPVIVSYLAGDPATATAAYAVVLPAINHENRQCGWRSAKAAMLEGNVIKSEFC